MKHLLFFSILLLCAFSAGTFSVPPMQTLSFGSFSPFASSFVSAQDVQTIKTSIRFVGDIMLARDVEYNMEKYGNEYPLLQMDTHPEDAYLVGNFEASIPKVHIPTKVMQFSFSVKPDAIAPLREYGFTHLGLANNHSYDFGSENFSNTKEVLENESLKVFGDQLNQASSTIEFLKVGKKNIALLGIYAVDAVLEKTEIHKLLARSEEADVQVAYIHWGEEYKSRHSKVQERLAHTLVDAGVDVIIGHHPHVVQDIQKYKKAIIFYSLGNFIFDQYFSEAVQQGLMVGVAQEGEALSFELIPVTSVGSRNQPRSMKGFERDLFLEELAKKSDTELVRMITEGKIHLAQ